MPRKSNPPITLIDPGDAVAAAMTALLPIHGAPTLDWLVDAAGAAAERLGPARLALVFLESEGGTLQYGAPVSDTRRRAAREAFGMLGTPETVAASPLLGEAIDSGKPMMVPLDEFAPGSTFGATTACVFPLEGAGERLGAILAVGDEMNPHHLRLVAEHATCALVNMRNAGALRDRAAVDITRAVFDVRKLETELQRELTRAARYKREVSICVIEATNMRLLRERFGDALTARLIDRLGVSLGGHAREIDLIGAYKESGFTMVLAEASSSGAESAAERLRSAVDGLTLEPPVPGLELHLVVGWATCPHDGATVDALFGAAEDRMYRLAA